MPRKFSSRGSKQLRRRAQHPTRVATRNNAVVTRQFRYTQTYSLNDENTFGQGGVEKFFAFVNPIGDYEGSSYISFNHEQFRVRRIKILARPSTGLYPPPAATADIATVIDTLQLQVSQYNAMNQTEVQSYVDYDESNVPTTYQELLIRPNLKIQCLKPTEWTTIANYIPRTLLQSSDGFAPQVVFQAHEWQTANYLGARLYGLSGRYTNRYNGPNISLPLVQAVDIMAIATVEMRGVRNASCNTLSVPRPVPYQTRDEDESEERVLDATN